MHSCVVPLEPPPSRIERPWTSNRLVVFLDYDGVLHRGDAFRTRQGIVSSDPKRIKLFEFADVLNELLAPYPHVELVLATSWVKVLGFNEARDAMPLAELRKRVRGATYHSRFDDAHLWNGVPRGQQILRYVARHRLVHWLAIDDRADGFGDYAGHLVRCDLDQGLGDVVVQGRLQAALCMQFGSHETRAD
ncbi:HAD domain-containing protein [Ralstonia pseudosolanacearum]|uniref:HAD domain-containing protein n=1 Tax=Ralstonia pseudosolanacearum TaxID=1310165 RepID=UPI00267675AE|nr:HAD domain-containing protein [Ralstonia pseudosolanacearum]MDO3622830.1 HAD domain-containing protein [Ralstonia pseudosolanacearum]